MSPDRVTPNFKQRVYNVLEDEWPETVAVTEVSDELEEDRERTRLAIRELHQRGQVSQTADWDYRAVELSEE